MSDPEWVTYAEAAERLGISVEGVRLKVKRDQKLGKDAQLHVRRDNNGRMLLAWDEALLDQRGVQHVGDDVGAVGAVDAGAIEALTKLLAQQHADHVAALAQQRDDHREDLDRLRAAHAAELERVEMRLIEERDRLQDQLQEALAEADHAKSDQVRMARDVTMMFDELKALADMHAALHADQARLQAELDQARAELARARRPWWRLTRKLIS